MPDNISRRKFMRNASVSAAAAGAVAAGGLGLFAGGGTADAAARPASDAPEVEGSGVIAHVVDAKKGEIAILVGTREIKYTNRAMAQQLMRAAK
jgi:hypothetical protein